MKTPICDFVTEYIRREPVRLHMPGHKGRGSAEERDITEIGGAGELYPARGPVLESEIYAAELFGSRRTLYSAEGSSLCIRAMVYLTALYAREKGIPARMLAGRNAHRTFADGAAALDVDVRWIPGESLLSCRPSPAQVEAMLAEEEYAAVYLTSPDYTGGTADIAGIAAVCRRRGVPLLIDNAHGAYLRFLERDAHPLTLGADLVCDSAHKTLPVLTGGAYLHTGTRAPEVFTAEAERALAFFASTSPSWLILQSLDRCNAQLSGEYPERIRQRARETEELRRRLEDMGYETAGQGDPLKLTLRPGKRGYTGEALHGELRKRGMECEFADPDLLVMMFSPENSREDLTRAERALEEISPRAPRREGPPPLPRPERVMSLRQAALRPAEYVPAERSLGRVLAQARVSCPPAVAPAVGGERIDEAVLACLRYYGLEEELLLCRE